MKISAHSRYDFMYTLLKLRLLKTIMGTVQAKAKTKAQEHSEKIYGENARD